MDAFVSLKKILWFLVEIFSLSLVLLIFVYFLLGQSSGPFVLEIVSNIGSFVKLTGENAVVALLIIISLILYLNNKTGSVAAVKKATATKRVSRKN
jgi:uncharacterized membrane protein